MSYLLDTDVAIHLRDGDPAIRSLMLGLDAIPAISAITRAELEGGVYAQPALTQQRRRAVDVLLSTFAVIDFTDAIAAEYGRIVEHAGFSRRKIVDRMIAATAVAEEMSLVTLNGRDFQDVPNLKLREWTRVTE